jgi:hypothetical protein
MADKQRRRRIPPAAPGQFIGPPQPPAGEGSQQPTFTREDFEAAVRRVIRKPEPPQAGPPSFGT